MANIITAYSYIIHPVGKDGLSESAYTVSRKDEGAGEFITITDGLGDTVKIELYDVEDVFLAARRLLEQVKEATKRD